jgi:hypothetical protein
MKRIITTPAMEKREREKLRTAIQRWYMLGGRHDTIIEIAAWMYATKAVIKAVVAELLQLGSFKTDESLRFLRATAGARVLFRPKVTSYLDRIYTVLLDLHVVDAELPTIGDEDARQEALARRRRLFNEFSAFFTTFDPLVAPYVEMHQMRGQFWKRLRSWIRSPRCCKRRK